MQGREVFAFAVEAMVRTVRELAARTGIEVEQIAHVVPHQANQRIIEAGMAGLGLPVERAVSHVARYGNTSAASIPIALEEGAREGRFAAGDRVALVAFGTGLAWGGAMLTWGSGDG
jgi:3-oxoacyl-[acyl-carrier-protein] synthase-3